MVYTEIKEINGKKYYYRVVSIRKGKKITKKRIYLGANLQNKNLKEGEKKADKEILLLNYILTDEEIKTLDKIKEGYKKEPHENFENRYEYFCSQFTYDSAAIEGNTLSPEETASLLFDNITPANKSQREVNEVINHKKAFDFLSNYQEDISKKLVLKLHELVVKDTLKTYLVSQIGVYRQVQVYIKGTNWMPPKPEEVPKEMANLLRWYSKNKEILHPLVLAAYFHVAFETIHPFVDGNGRTGRLLMNFILHKDNFPMINIPNKIKTKYYECLREAQLKGNLRPFITFLLDLIKSQEVMF